VTKFVLLSTQRSGSAYIRSALSSYPGIKCHGELFQDISSMDNNTPHYSISFHKSLSNSILKRFFIKISKRIIIDNYFNNFMKESSDLDIIGFKLMYDHLNRYPQIFDLVKNNDVKIIYLIRVNLQQTITSLERVK